MVDVPNVVADVDDICHNSIALQIIETLVCGIGLMITVWITIIGIIQFNKSTRKSKSTPCVFKYMFYVCMILGIMTLLLFLLSIINCYSYFLSITSSHIVSITLLVIYAVLISHLFFVWLLRLHHIFRGTEFAKDNTFYIIITAVFLVMALLEIGGLILFILNIYTLSSILVVIGAFGYFAEAVWLMFVFLREFMRFITHKVMTIRFKSIKTLKNVTKDLDLPSRDIPIIHLIAKYLVLGTTSFTTTFFVFIVALIYIIDVINPKYEIMMLHIVKLLIIIDVITNILCIYLQYSYARCVYNKLCGWVDKKVNQRVHKRAATDLRTNTFAFYEQELASSQDPEAKDTNIEEAIINLGKAMKQSESPSSPSTRKVPPLNQVNTISLKSVLDSPNPESLS